MAHADFRFLREKLDCLIKNPSINISDEQLTSAILAKNNEQ